MGAPKTFPTRTAEMSVFPLLPGTPAHPLLVLWNQVRDVQLDSSRSIMFASDDIWPPLEQLLSLMSSFVGGWVSLVDHIVASPSMQGVPSDLKNSSITPVK